MLRLDEESEWKEVDKECKEEEIGKVKKETTDLMQETALHKRREQTEEIEMPEQEEQSDLER